MQTPTGKSIYFFPNQDAVPSNANLARGGYVYKDGSIEFDFYGPPGTGDFQEFKGKHRVGRGWEGRYVHLNSWEHGNVVSLLIRHIEESMYR